MFGLTAGVQLTDLGPRDGLMRGTCGGYRWEARLTRGPVSYGLDPVTCYKGQGRIVRLVLYQPLGPETAYRKAAAYDKAWQFGRKEHIRAIERVVRYLERR